jgi:hypothetical protein
VWTRTLAFCFLAGCIAQVQTAINPTPSGGGTLTCRQVAEQCDSQCRDPLCLRRCGEQGTPEAAQQHAAVVDCGQRNSCMDEGCMRSSCAVEMATCEGAPPDPEPYVAPEPQAAPAPGY